MNKKWKGIPRPPRIPVPSQEFVRLVCGGTEHFEKFIEHLAKAHIAGGVAGNFEDCRKSLLNHFLGLVTDEQRVQHAGKTDDEIAGILFDENFAAIVKGQRDNYANFPSADSWLAAARDWNKCCCIKPT